MNGRVYDPTLGRFLSADPYVQAPYFSQSYNRYTYTFNNPLIFNDPSGYLADENVNESSKETEDRKEKEKPEKPKPEPKKKTPEKEAKEKAKDEAKKEETGDEEKADDKNECYDSAFCYHIAGDDLSKPGSSEKKEGEDTSKKKKGDVDGKDKDAQKERIKKLMGGSAADRQKAIGLAAEYYGLDLSTLKGIDYVEGYKFDGEYSAEANWITLGDGAFKSLAVLGATIGHELVHAKQYAIGGVFLTSGAIREVSAYDWEMRNAGRLGLTNQEQMNILVHYNSSGIADDGMVSHFRELSPSQRRAFDAGAYRVDF